MKPSSDASSFMPTSAGESTSAEPRGPAVGSKTVQGQLRGPLKLQVLSAASGLPARSLTPAAPLLTVAVIVCPYGRFDDGVSVAVWVDALYATDAGIAVPEPSASVNVWAVTVEASIASSNVTVGLVVTGRSSAPSAGVKPLTRGAR